MFGKFRSFLKRSEGATAIEYGLIAALVAVVAIGGLSASGTSLANMFTHVSDTINEPVDALKASDPN
jgi:pilus assembly protein Flp/PilA